MNRLSYWLIIFIVCCACGQNDRFEKYQKERNEIMNVHAKVKEIKTANVLIGGISRMYLMNDYLIIGDYQSQDKLIHLFNKNTFEYIASTANRGQGPGEIANMGHIGINEKDHMFYVSDHGKQTIFAFQLDSLIANPFYEPSVKMRMNEKQFPDKYTYINDTLCVGLIIAPIGNADYKPSVARWNMDTGEINTMQYEHPEIDKKRITFAVSVEHGVYVECYSYYDLMTICGLDGKLKYNIYGQSWSDQRGKGNRYYGSVAFCKDKIVALYSGEDSSSGKSEAETKNSHPTKFHVFNIVGDYILSLETGYQITAFCYDKENNRIIMCLDDEIQFACLELDELTS